MNYINYSYSLDIGRSTGSIESINFIKYTYKRVCWVYKIPWVPGYTIEIKSRSFRSCQHLTDLFGDKLIRWRLFWMLKNLLQARSFHFLVDRHHPSTWICNFQKKKCEIWKFLEINLKKSVNPKNCLAENEFVGHCVGEKMSEGNLPC